MKTSAEKVNPHLVLDAIKHKIACEVLARFTIAEIKERSLSNIRRWRANGTSGQAYDAWERLAMDPDDGKMIAVMEGTSDYSNQLRQSPPFVGMLDKELVRKINEEVSG
ncbi:hypothetical protein [Duganella sp. FT27W]|nr:hypothetical protein [Duganella sp. FT27W]KQN79053.1 hypothetical protein ASF04_00720 [Duganella sp. Leaf61]MPQ59710.1 hypothetical protein [Duganella sp. FT27W]